MLLFLLSGSCIQAPPPTVKYLLVKHFTLADTTRIATEYFTRSNIEFPIFYIGPVKDTVFIGRQYRRERILKPKWPPVFAASRAWSDKNLKIEVDTSLIVDCPLEYLRENSTVNEDSTHHYYAYPLIIQNISDSILFMGRTFEVYLMHVEIRNQQGHWIKVSRKLAEYPLCITGEPSIYLRPKEIMISKFRLIKCYPRVERRLAFGWGDHHSYSNTF